MADNIETNVEEEVSETSVFQDLQNDYKNAKEAKTEIDEKIAEWNDDFDGIMKSMKNRSKYKSKEIAKQIEKIKTNITEPFTNTSHPVRLSTSKDEARARIQQKYLNTQFTSEFDRVTFMNTLADVLCREGTVWVKSAWNFEERNKRLVLENATMEEVMARGEEPDTIKQKDNGRFHVEYNSIEVCKNDPDAIICRNEHCFPDPMAREREDMRYFCHKKLTSISDLRKLGRYSEEKLNKIEAYYKNDDTHLGSHRNSKAQSHGYKEGTDTNDIARRKIAVIEYYGYYDLNGDGIAEPIFASWVEDSNTELVIEEKSLPNNDIPFYNEVFSSSNFNLWGNALAYFIKDNQRAKTGIMRGILDNMALANNGQKFIKKGTLDYVNFKKLVNGEKYIQTNKDASPEALRDGSFNNLPSAIFNTYQMVSSEADELSGSKGNGMALDSSQLSEDNGGQLTLAQQMMAGLVIKVSSLLGHVFTDWLKFAEVFLENDQINALFTESEQQDLYSFEDNQYVKVSFKVGTNAQRQMRLQQLNMLMQQSKVLGENMPPEHIRELVAEMFELFDMYEKAEAIRTYQPQPNPQQVMMQQLELQDKQLELAKKKAEIRKINAEAQLAMSNSQSSVLDSMAGVQYKQAQSTEKYSKAKGHDVANALKPAEAYAQIENMMGNLNNNQG